METTNAPKNRAGNQAASADTVPVNTAGTGPAPLLEMRNIRKDFFGNQVLTDINLTLRSGEVLGLVGENGAGKSTLMKILFGMDVIRETGGYGGDILLNGRKVQFDTPFAALSAGIGMVHQEFSLIPGFTATENILLNREPKKSSIAAQVFGDRLNTLDRAEMDRRSAAAIEKMGFSIDAHMAVSRMPVGHKQFTEIARELSKEQLKLLILDEPTAVLTEREAEALLDAVRAMSARGIAVIFITHRLQEILSVCDTVSVMRDGCMVRNIPAAETDIPSITRWMVGRAVNAPGQGSAEGQGDSGGTAGKARNIGTAGKNKTAGNIETAGNTGKAVSFTERDNSLSAAAEETGKTILSIRRLWVDMPGETVRDVNLDVREGEILGIGGLAGQGKLGIPNGVMGLCEAGGTVLFDGQEIPLNSPRLCLDASLAFVSEDRRGVGLLLDESLEWNIAFPAMQIRNRFLKTYLGGLIKWRDEGAMGEATRKYIEQFQIRCTGSKQSARELSGGNQQKVCLAKAFALEPRLLFVSEPTRGIDVGAKALVLNAIRQFNRESGVTVVVISSELEELRQTCGRIAIVSGGRVAGILPASRPAEEFGALMVSQVI